MAEIPKIPLHQKPPPPDRPDGWWSIYGDDFDGSREGVCSKLKAYPEMPAEKNNGLWIPVEVKVALLAAISKKPANFNHVRINAHHSCGDVHGKKIHNDHFDFDIQYSEKL
jgi:hypothetical protein